MHLSHCVLAQSKDTSEGWWQVALDKGTLWGCSQFLLLLALLVFHSNIISVTQCKVISVHIIYLTCWYNIYITKRSCYSTFWTKINVTSRIFPPAQVERLLYLLGCISPAGRQLFLSLQSQVILSSDSQKNPVNAGIMDHTPHFFFFFLMSKLRL